MKISTLLHSLKHFNILNVEIKLYEDMNKTENYIFL